eukprot:INCI14269.1.p1 GENE.INCI14269.1~~INCI14269.1.p1  ORF type:complete len:715 (+),score=90.92 INCI14269.1:500-2644(+)
MATATARSRWTTRADCARVRSTRTRRPSRPVPTPLTWMKTSWRCSRRRGRVWPTQWARRPSAKRARSKSTRRSAWQSFKNCASWQLLVFPADHGARAASAAWTTTKKFLSTSVLHPGFSTSARRRVAPQPLRNSRPRCSTSWRSNAAMMPRQRRGSRIGSVTKKMKKMNLPFAVQQISKLNDPLNAVHRGKLVLPAPVVSEEELAEIAKSGDAESAQALLAAGGSAATQTLLGNYEATPGGRTPGPGATPQRTPARTGHDVVQEEIRNAIARTNQQTPLQGGENVELAPGTGFAGHTPSRTPGGSTPMGGSSTTPSHRAGGSTPVRDSLGINVPGGPSANAEALMAMVDAGQQRRDEEARLREIRSEVESGLSALPAPQFVYAATLPAALDDADGDDSNAADGLELDASELDARRAAREEKKRQEELKKRSAAIQRGLPRPRKVNKRLQTTGRDQAESLILQGAHDVMHVDHVLFPEDDGKGKKRKGPSAKKLASLPNVPTFQRDELVAARQLIQAEASAGPGPVDVDTFAAAWDAVHGGAGLGTPEVVFLPSQGKFGPWASASRPDRLATITLQYNQVCELMAKMVKRADKLTEATRRRLAGYQRRAAGLAQSTAEAVRAAQEKDTELACFEHLDHLEQGARRDRVTAAELKLKEEAARETELQARYAALTSEYESLVAAAAAAAARRTRTLGACFNLSAATASVNRLPERSS